MDSDAEKQISGIPTDTHFLVFRFRCSIQNHRRPGHMQCRGPLIKGGGWRIRWFIRGGGNAHTYQTLGKSTSHDANDLNWNLDYCVMYILISGRRAILKVKSTVASQIHGRSCLSNGL